MKNYLKNLSVKDKILLVSTVIILFTIAGVLIYDSTRDTILELDDTTQAPTNLHELSDGVPRESNGND